MELSSPEKDGIDENDEKCENPLRTDLSIAVGTLGLALASSPRLEPVGGQIQSLLLHNQCALVEV